jgi:hypothetical protein
VLSQLLSSERINKLIQQQLVDPVHAYSLSGMLNDLQKGIFSELVGHQPIDIYRRNLQKMYVEDLIRLIAGTTGGGGINVGNITMSAGSSGADKTSDAISVIKAHIKAMASQIKAALPAAPDRDTRNHLQDIYERLTNALQPKKD